MQSIAILPEKESSKKNFYPTPHALANKLLAGIDWETVNNILEPSAGKGDLAETVKTSWKAGCGYYRSSDHEWDIDCVEIDEYLRAILKERGFRVVGDDFLALRTYKRYSLIVMNPPFDQGAKHLLKALEVQEHGGAIYCILNAETLRNTCSYERQKLRQKLEEYEAEIEYVSGAFAAAERKTDVEVALVRCVIPYVEGEATSTILEALNKAEECRKEQLSPEQADIIKGDFIAAAVDRCNYEMDAACRLIREWRALKPLLLSDLKREHPSFEHHVMQLVTGSYTHSGGKEATENAVVKLIRAKYWDGLFQDPRFTKNLTSNLQYELRSMVNKLQDYDFSEYNIYSIRLELQKKLVKGVEATIMALFDDWTRKHHWDENSQNRHYYDGWRTNDAFAVNKKVIIPFYGVFDDWNGKFKPTDYRVMQKLADIEKVFDFLGSTKDERKNMESFLKNAEETGQSRKIPLTYFNVTFYKKGTCHIEFTDLDVLKKFNLFAARGKNWLPPCYGRKRYQDMDAEEQAVVDSFEGEKSYAETLAKANYFLGTVGPLGLMEGGTVDG